MALNLITVVYGRNCLSLAAKNKRIVELKMITMGHTAVSVRISKIPGADGIGTLNPGFREFSDLCAKNPRPFREQYANNTRT